MLYDLHEPLMLFIMIQQKQKKHLLINLIAYLNKGLTITVIHARQGLQAYC